MSLTHLHPGPCPGRDCHACDVCARRRDYRDRDIARLGITKEEAELITPWLGETAAKKPIELQCVHRGAEVDRVQCGSCVNSKAIVNSCAVHGKATMHRKAVIDGVKRCRECAERQAVQRPLVVPLVKPITRNLLYHIYPIGTDGVWQWNVEQIMCRIDLFNGKRCVGIVTDKKTCSVDDVKATFKGEVDEWVILPNDRSLREVKTFRPLFDSVLTTDPNHVTFYGHSKGVHRQSLNSLLWAEMLYEANLDDWPAVERFLESVPCVGAFKKIGKGFRTSRSAWHFSGSFFWVHNATLASRNWTEIDKQWFGIEAWLSLHFSAHEAASVFTEGKNASIDLYKHAAEFKEKWEQWKQQRSASGTASGG